jgi:hypothetical protein
LKGVTRHGRQKQRWQAHIMHEGKNFHLGTFSTKEEAHAAYCKAGRRFFGDYFCDGRAP